MFVCATVQPRSHFSRTVFLVFCFFVGTMPAKSGASKRSSVKAKAKALSKADRDRAMKQARTLAMQAIHENPNFRLFSDTQLYGTLVAGKSLVDTMIEAKFAKVTGDPSCPKFGSAWYSALAASYGGDRSSGDALAPSAASADLPLRESVVQAAMAWDDTPRRGQVLFDWLVVETKDCIFCFLCLCVV